MPGPMATDANFERTFSDLAYARLRDKAPSLLDYLIGFQLIDKNEEETHAIGVFGFKVGKEWVYAPVFFINGELKGHELMYIKSQDAFVPMTEPWVNYLLNRRPRVLGEVETTPRNQLGLRQPDFDLFARSPYIGSKYASAHLSFKGICSELEKKSPEFLPFMSVFATTPKSEKYASLDKRFTLVGALNSLGKQAAVNLFNTMKKDHKFAEAILKHYDLRDLTEFTKKASKVAQTDAEYKENASFSFCSSCANYNGNRGCNVVSGDVSPNGTCKYFAQSGVKNEIEPIKAADYDQKTLEQRKGKSTVPSPVVVLRGDDGSNVKDELTDAEKQKLLKDQYVVRDDRADEQKSKLYKTQIASTFNSPFKSGFYKVLTARGESKRLLALQGPMSVGYCCGRQLSDTLLVDTENKVLNCYSNNDILTNSYEGEEAFDKFYSGLNSTSSVTPGSVVILVNKEGDSIGTMEVDSKSSKAGGADEWRVGGINCRAKSTLTPRTANACGPNSYKDIDTIIFTDKDGEGVAVFGSTAFVPKGYKALVIRSGKAKKNEPYDSFKTDFLLGSINDMVTNLKTASYSNKGVAELQIRTDGIRFTPVVNGSHGPRLSKTAALKYLIVNQGLGQEDAEFLLKEAHPRKASAYFVKYAYGEPPASAQFNEPIYGDEMGIKAPIQYPQTEMQNLGQNDFLGARELYRNDRYMDNDAKSYAQSASQMGQKEVMDTSVITGLVKTLDTDGLIDGYIGDLLLGLDRVGRILFCYYWHNEKFKDRYGQQDMIELEDNLRNVFKNLGDLALFLKQKTVAPDDANSSEVELTDVLGG